MDAEAYIKTMVSREGEVVELKPEIKFKENPKLYEWLDATEKSMQRTLAVLLQNAVTEILQSDRQGVDTESMKKFVSWVDRFPTQIVILAQQVVWSQEVDTSLRKRGEAEKMLISIRSRIVALLADLADRVLSDLKSDTRKKYEQLITDMVHQRDVTRSLVSKKITTRTILSGCIKCDTVGDPKRVIFPNVLRFKSQMHDFSTVSSTWVLEIVLFKHLSRIDVT